MYYVDNDYKVYLHLFKYKTSKSIKNCFKHMMKLETMVEMVSIS